MNRLVISFAVASLAMASGSAFAASQGTQGATSSGDTTITLTNSQRVIVAGIEDIGADTATYGGTGDFSSGWMDFCIGQNTGFAFDVTFESDNAGAPATDYFVEDAGATDTIGYTVTFADDPSGAGATTTVDGGTQDTVANVDLGAGREPLGCNTDNVSMQVTFNGADLGAATAASYEDILTITITPQ